MTNRRAVLQLDGVGDDDDETGYENRKETDAEWGNSISRAGKWIVLC